jgi:heat shock protein HtpX
MSRLDTGETQVTTVAATTVGLPILLAERWLRADGPIKVVGRALTPLALLVAPLVGRVLDHDLDVRADLAGVALTRFPPGLAAALDKIRADDPSIPSAPSSTAPLWLLPPFASADDRPIPGVVRHLPTHRPLVERVDFLRER